MALPTKFLVLGANGRLGKALVRRYAAQGLAVQAIGRGELDLAKPASVALSLSRYSFDVLINAAGDTDVDRCEMDPGGAQLVNALSPAAAASYCAANGAQFVQVSTDYVFAGEPHADRIETDAAEPINHYGRSKLAGEQAVLAAHPLALVLRVSWLFGLEKPSFPDRIIKDALAKDEVSAVNDKWACPTYADDVTEWTLALIESRQHGVVHLCNEGACTWLEYGQAALDIAASLGLPLKTTALKGHSMHGFSLFKAARPPYTALDTALFTRHTGIAPRHWKTALEEYLRKCYLQPAAGR
ncbi:MAG: spore coat protein [Verrucomicrobiaceae bacterium]|nr:spore coat protein [Verrucomicrobiaceae bacterium]